MQAAKEETPPSAPPLPPPPEEEDPFQREKEDLRRRVEQARLLRSRGCSKDECDRAYSVVVVGVRESLERVVLPEHRIKLLSVLNEVMVEWRSSSSLQAPAPPPPAAPQPPQPAPETSLVQGAFVDMSSFKKTLDDVAGMDELKRVLRAQIQLPEEAPHLFRGEIRPRRTWLFYGPPGTGKTFLLKCVAAERGYAFAHVKPSLIMDKMVGNTEKIIKQLFDEAKKREPCIVMFDEIDKLFPSSDAEYTKRSLAEFLGGMDDMLEGNFRVIIGGGTNYPWNIDPAMVRRFKQKTFVDLPTTEARRRMLESYLLKLRGGHQVTPFDVQAILRATEGWSAFDFENLFEVAEWEVVYEATDSGRYIFGVDQRWTPAPPCDGCVWETNDLCSTCGSVPRRADELGLKNVDARPLSGYHILRATQKVDRAVLEDQYKEKLRAWHARCSSGQE